MQPAFGRPQAAVSCNSAGNFIAFICHAVHRMVRGGCLLHGRSADDVRDSVLCTCVGGAGAASRCVLLNVVCNAVMLAALCMAITKSALSSPDTSTGQAAFSLLCFDPYLHPNTRGTLRVSDLPTFTLGPTGAQWVDEVAYSVRRNCL